MKKNKYPKLLESINAAKIDGAWKGICWDRIEISENDTTLILFTDGKIIGTNGSGLFYKLDNEIILNELNKHKSQ